MNTREEVAIMRFIKMHGAGNDYVYVDGFEEAVNGDAAALARAISDRHTGVGGDGLVLILPSEQAPVRMQMFNADGSEAEMCGNAIRCVAKYVVDRELVTDDGFVIETAAGIKKIEIVERTGGLVSQVRVNMGCPILDAADIPTTMAGTPPQNVPLDVGGRSLTVTCVSMGNPHCVTFVDDITDELVLGLGPQVETHPAFPRKINVEFIKVISPAEFDMRVWERGSGETMACGTGACAAAVAGAVTGRLARKTTAHLRGGDLHLEWTDSGDVLMTGPAVEVFRGEWPS